MPDRVQRQKRSYESGNNEEENEDAVDLGELSDAESEHAEDDLSSSATMTAGQALTSTSMPPPPRPIQADEANSTLQTQQPPQSAQRNQTPQASSTIPADTQADANSDGRASQEIEAPTTTTDDVPEDEQMLDQPSPNDQLVNDQAPSGPDEPIAEFDWPDLEKRYRQKTEELDKEEKKIYQEFADLVQYFDAWMETIEDREKKRGTSRLTTQIRYVQRKEEELEKKGEHYVKVVDAFKTITRILYAPDTVSAPESVATRTANNLPSELAQHDRFFARFLETKCSPSSVVAKPPARVKAASGENSSIHTARCVVS